MLVFISVCGRYNERKTTTIVTETCGSIINCLMADIHQDLKIFYWDLSASNRFRKLENLAFTYDKWTIQISLLSIYYWERKRKPTQYRNKIRDCFITLQNLSQVANPWLYELSVETILVVVFLIVAFALNLCFLIRYRTVVRHMVFY